MKELRTFPLASSREILNLPLGYQAMKVGHLHGMVRLYVMGDWGNALYEARITMTENSTEVPAKCEYVGTVEHSTGYTHVWVSNAYD